MTGISDSYESAGQELWEEGSLALGNFSQPTSSEGSVTLTDKNDEAVITNIQATDVALGLRRLPAGFYAVVYYNGLEWRTENKPSPVNDDVVEWSASILVPSDLSAIVHLEVYASFEFQPMLGAGEQLRKLTTTVEELLNRSDKGVPFTFFPKDGDVVSSCTSILVTVKQGWRKSADPSVTQILGPHHSTTELKSELEDAANQGQQALSRYRKHGVRRDLQHSIEQFEQALSICPLDHPCRAAALSNLAMTKLILCHVENKDASVEVSLRLYCDALSARPVGHLDRPYTLIQLGAIHLARFQMQVDEVEFTRAEALLQEAVKLSSPGSHEYWTATFLLQLHSGRRVGSVQPDERSSGKASTSDPTIRKGDSGPRNLHHSERSGDLADLQQEIIDLQDQLRSTSIWDSRYCEMLGDLGVSLACRFELLGSLSDLEDAVSMLSDAVDLSPDGHPGKPGYLNNLANCLVFSFKRFGKLHDLDCAILRHRNAIDLIPHGHGDKSGCLGNLGSSLITRFEHLGKLGDLEEAISRHRDAADLTPHDHPNKPACLANLGHSLLTRFKRFGKLGDLEEAISILSNAATITPYGHLQQAAWLNQLGNCHVTRFEHLGELSDLEDAISRHMDAVNSIPRGHPQRPVCVHNLGITILTRFERLEELNDLEDAISTLKDAVDLTPHEDVDKPIYLNSIATCLEMRFDRLGERSDLEAAISMFRNAVDLTPHDHPEMPGRLNNLATSLKTRFERYGEPALSDLEDALSMFADAVNLMPHHHPDRPAFLSNLGSCFLVRFRHLKELRDLEDAITTLRGVVNLTPRGHPMKPNRLERLGNAVITRFIRMEELSDLDDATLMFRDTVDLTPHGHPHKPSHLNNLGNCFCIRFQHLGEQTDLEQAISLYCHAASTPIGLISDRFLAAQNWIWCAKHIYHHSLLHAYSVAISLLPQLAWSGLSLTHRYEELLRGADLAREAAAVALDSGFPETAVEWLEQGRSIVWGELFLLRSSYEELSSAYPSHARKLRELSAALENATATREKYFSSLLEQPQRTAWELTVGPIDDKNSWKTMELTKHVFHRVVESMNQQIGRSRTLAIERDKLLQEIRSFPGFEQFLLRKEFSYLRAAAHSGPVVILNSAKSRCDALIILPNLDHVIHVPHPNFSFQRSADLASSMKGFIRHAREGKREPQDGVTWEHFLSPLWKSVIKPVLDGLAFSTPGDLSRIFWCPTGPFVSLPIHAAGLYDTQYSQPGSKVFDFVISSYVPNLSILGSPLPTTVPRSDLCLLAVGQPASDGESRLPGVAIELEHIREIIEDSHSSHTTLLESSTGTVEEVLDLMKRADWVHFACHGIQDPWNPVNSGLCLADKRRLKLRDIISLLRPQGGLAFLSACQTATGYQNLSDEVIHITAGMLFAGYVGVVGTMWSISDKLAPDVAKDVYRYLFRNGTRPDYREAAHALHEAIGGLRDRQASFVEWVPFIHVGL